jgi:hypothetical protein
MKEFDSSFRDFTRFNSSCKTNRRESCLCNTTRTRGVRQQDFSTGQRESPHKYPWHATHHQTLPRDFLLVASAERLPIRSPPSIPQARSLRSISSPAPPFRRWVSRSSFPKRAGQIPANLGVHHLLCFFSGGRFDRYIVSIDCRLEMAKTCFKLEHPLGLFLLSCLSPC